MYNVLTLWLQQAYIHQGADSELIAAESLMFWTYMSDIIRPTLEVMSNTHVGGAFQPKYRTGLRKGIVVIEEMMGAQNESAIVDAFRKDIDKIRRHQRNELFKISQDLQALAPFVEAIAPLYKKIYNGLIYGTRVMVDEYDARICYGINETRTAGNLHPKMTANSPPWNPNTETRAARCANASGSNILWNSNYEERGECTVFGNNSDSRLIKLHFRGWFQVRMATDPDPPNEFAGVTGNAFALADEPILDRAICFQPGPATPARKLNCMPYTPFGIQVTEITVHQYETNPGKPPITVQLDNLSDLPIDKQATNQINGQLQRCILDLKPVSSEHPTFKSDNYLMGMQSEGIDNFNLSLSCNGIELAARQTFGPPFQEMTPGQRQFLGRFSQRVHFIPPENNQQSIGFPHPQSAWRYFRQRQRLLRDELQTLLPLNTNNPHHLKLIGRIFDTFRAMPRELIDADDKALEAVQLLQDLADVVARGSCDLAGRLQKLQEKVMDAFNTSERCRLDPVIFTCATYENQTTAIELNQNITFITLLAYRLCKNVSQDPSSFAAAIQNFTILLESMIPGGAVFMDIRFMRLGFDAPYLHSISGPGSGISVFNDILSSFNYTLQWKNRTFLNVNETCSQSIGPNDRWGINYHMKFFDTDLLWGYAEGDLWIPITPTMPLTPPTPVVSSILSWILLIFVSFVGHLLIWVCCARTTPKKKKDE
jgi:hypothetical protein